MTAAAWPPKRSPSRAGGRQRPDLEALTGLRSGKPHYYPEHRTSVERMRRVIHALDRISAALVHTAEGSEALVRAVVDAAADHLSAEWVIFALVDGELPDARPRHLVLGPDGVEWRDTASLPERVLAHIADVARDAHDDGHDPEHARRHLHVPVRLDGRVVGGFAAWTPRDREIDATDHSVLRILAGQTAAALQNCALMEHSARLYARASRQAEDLRVRNDELVATQAELGAARQREVLDNERHRIARELHDSVTQYALSAGMHIELVRSEISDGRLRGQLGTAKDLTRRAVVRLAYRAGQVRLTVSDDGCGRPDEVRRSLRAATVTAPCGEHRGLVNMAARASELGGALTFRRARLGGLQVQVDVPVPVAS